MHKKHSSEEGETSTCVRDWNPSQISIFLPQKPKINVIVNVFKICCMICYICLQIFFATNELLEYSQLYFKYFKCYLN